MDNNSRTLPKRQYPDWHISWGEIWEQYSSFESVSMGISHPSPIWWRLGTKWYWWVWSIPFIDLLQFASLWTISLRKTNVLHNLHLCISQIALIQLPEPIKPCKTVKPAKLPTTCDAQMGNENVIVAGMGLTQVDDDSYNDRIIRYAEFVTISSETCAEQFTGPFNSKSVICTKTINGTAFYTGDSGDCLDVSIY